MNEWTVSSDALDRVQAGVMGRIRRRRWAGRSLGVAALLLAMTFWPVMPDMETLALGMPVPPAAPEWVPVAAPKKVPVVWARAVSAPAGRITIYTDDPDVVIVLVGDGGGE